MKRLKVTLNNLYLFLTILAPRVPPWRWRQTWQRIHDDHRKQVDRQLLAMRLDGEIRMDSEGRLWSNRQQKQN